MPDYAHVRNVTPQAQGLWRLRGAEVVPVDRDWAGPPTVLAPSEWVTTKAVDLPFPSRVRRLAAAPFAVEDLIAEPLGQVHVALGMETSPGRHLVAVVRHSVMRDWLETLQAAGLERCVLMPDALAVPLPPLGSWRLATSEGRAVVRTDDGAGFAAEVGLLPALWDSAGRPPLLVTGDGLPASMREGVAEASIEMDGMRPVVVVPPVDLRQGVHAAPREAAWGPWRAAAAIAAAGAVAHLAIGAVDAAALHMMAERREAETRALIAERDAGLAQQPDLVAAVDRLAPLASGGDGPFTRTFARAAAALSGRPLTYRAIVYGGDGGATTLAVTAPDMTAVQEATRSLSAQALPATAALDPLAEAAPTATGVNAVITVREGAAG